MELPRFSTGEEADAAAFFAENGFVVLSNVLSKDRIRDLRCEIRNVINAFCQKAGLPEYEDDRAFTEGLMALEAADHEYVASIYDTIFQTPAFFRLIGDADVERIVRNLMGAAPSVPLYGFTNRCRIDPPSDDRRTYGWHQEVFYTIPEGSFLQTWAPLVFDTTVANGTIHVCPGSHMEGIPPQSWNEMPGRALQVIIDDDVIAKYQPTAVEMRLGELLIFSGKLAHKSGRNTSDQVRYSLVGMYHDVRHLPFRTPRLGFSYRGQTPKEYYDSVFAAG